MKGKASAVWQGGLKDARQFNWRQSPVRDAIFIQHSFWRWNWARTRSRSKDGRRLHDHRRPPQGESQRARRRPAGIWDFSEQCQAGCPVLQCRGS